MSGLTVCTFNIRGDESRQCILVLIGVTGHGKKELIAIEDGYRESAQSWEELLARHPAPALLGTQDRKRAEQAA